MLWKLKLLVLGVVFVLGMTSGMHFVNRQAISQKKEEIAKQKEEIAKQKEEIAKLTKKVSELERQIDMSDGLYRTSTVFFVGLCSTGIATLFTVVLMRCREQVRVRDGACNVKKQTSTPKTAVVMSENALDLLRCDSVLRRVV